MLSNSWRKVIRDYLNNEVKLTELINTFDLSYCDKCEQYELKEDLVEIDQEQLCESCRNNRDI